MRAPRTPKGTPPPGEQPVDRLATRGAHLFLGVVIGLAFVGFFVGIRQGTTIPELTPPEMSAVEPHPEAVRATFYEDFDRRRTSANRDWRSTLSDLKQPTIDLFAELQTSEAKRQSVLAARAERRAFDGAPPVVPHPIDQMTASSCHACHGEGIAIGGGVYAPKMSHAFLANCTQCHVEAASGQLAPELVAQNHFQGKPAPQSGSRAWTGAPPVVPHAVFMRENCLSCHGPTGAEPIRTSHPYRASCLQCHAPSAVLDQVIADDRPAWLGEDEPSAGPHLPLGAPAP